MVERHRGGGGRGGDFNRGRDTGRQGRDGGSGRGSREGREDRPRRNEGFGGFSDRPSYRDRNQFRAPAAPMPVPPAAPANQDQFEEVEADLAVAILETAAHLTEIVGTAGLPEGHAERRAAVLETFETIYYHVLETVTGGDEAEEADEE